jgi:organic radical activating enzyme
MTKTILLISTLTIILTSCGPSKAELEAKEKAKMDSVVQATKDDIARKQAIQDSIAALAEEQNVLKQDLVDLKAKYAAEYSKLQNIYQFKLLRTPDEKAQQIEEQTKIVEQLKSDIKDISSKIKN